MGSLISICFDENLKTMAKEKVATDVRDLVLQKMTLEGRTMQWLATKTKINYNTLHSCIKRKLFILSGANLRKINTALGTSFTEE